MHQRSINFNNDEEACTFAKHAGLAKFNTLGGATLVAQDQLVGKGVNEVKLGDSLEVRYSAHLIDAATGAIGAEFDSNTTAEKAFRFKVGKNKVIQGWEQGVLGMRKGGKRVLCVPATLGYGAAGAPPRIPANASLIFGIEITKHKTIYKDPGDILDPILGSMFGGSNCEDILPDGPL